jgi:hypothetical protein
MVRIGGKKAALIGCLAVLLVCSGMVSAKLLARPFGGPAAAGMINLPYMVQDGQGNQWRVYQFGQIQQTGNMPIYSQGAMLMINGNQPSVLRNQARIVDEKTGEIALEHMNMQGFDVTRRILIDKDTNVVRYVDIVKNTQGTDQTVNLMIQTTLNYGVNTAANVPDAKRKGQDVGWVAQTGAGAAVAEVYCGKNTKNPMRIDWQNGNNVVSGSIQLNIPAGKEVAVVHLHAIQPTQDAAANWVKNLKESDILKSLPHDIRKLVVNFAGTQGMIGDVEILRGDMLDVVELKSGDQLKGTLKESAYDLTTFYGPVSVPVDRVIGLLNVGQFRPRQLVVTVDGQIFGGTLKKETMDLQLSSGQVTQIPLSQVSRVGYRKRVDEPEEWTFEKPIVLMRSGERIGVKMPAGPIECQTRYGKLSLKPEQIAAVVLQSEDTSVHEFHLTDGSKFTGLLSADEFEMKLDGAAGAPEQSVKFPVSSIARLQFTPKVVEPDDATPTIRLANDDQLVGSITGQLKVDTAFDTIQINASEIRSMVHPKEGSVDVQVVLWDGSSLSGQLQELELPCQLAGGVEMRVPVSLLVEYNQPQPQPSHEMEDRIRAVIADLNADDWKKRDRAQAALVSMGPVAINTLKKMRENQPPEAQKRIAEILNELEKQKDKKPGGTGGTSPGASAQPQQQPVLIENYLAR